MLGAKVTAERIVEAEREGEEAAKNGLSFRNNCPYLYSRFPFLSPQDFEAKYRPLLNAWFNGWKKWLDDNGLQYHMKPRRVRT